MAFSHSVTMRQSGNRLISFAVFVAVFCVAAVLATNEDVVNADGRINRETRAVMGRQTRAVMGCQTRAVMGGQTRAVMGGQTRDVMGGLAGARFLQARRASY
jgi:uncharacterized membrane protein